MPLDYEGALTIHSEATWVEFCRFLGYTIFGNIVVFGISYYLMRDLSDFVYSLE